MINVAVICFTEKGVEIAKRIKEVELTGGLKPDEMGRDYSFELYAKFDSFDESKHEGFVKVEASLCDWTLSMQQNKYALVFIGATGIAVRAIAKGLENKLSDSAVVVIDEVGLHAIPLVSGHVGGANELALFLATNLGADPVITTATDIENTFAADLFAKENGLTIFNKDGIKKVSSKALCGKAVRISIENYPPKEADIIISSDDKYKRMKDGYELLLCPKNYAVGIGCKRGTSFGDLKEFFLRILRENSLKPEDIGAIASIDLKIDEEGIIELSHYFRIPFITYTAEILNMAAGDFEESDFVKEKTGVGNVCERAAMLLTGNRGSVILKKTSENGMTMAIARMK